MPSQFAPPRPPPPPLKNGAGVNFDYLRRRGGWKIKKRGGSMVQGQVLLKEVVGGGADTFPKGI